jgi:hypothetical protein
VRKISPPPRFDSRTVEPVASRYNDWDITALRHYMKTKPKLEYILIKKKKNCYVNFYILTNAELLCVNKVTKLSLLSRKGVWWIGSTAPHILNLDIKRRWMVSVALLPRADLRFWKCPPSTLKLRKCIRLHPVWTLGRRDIFAAVGNRNIIARWSSPQSGHCTNLATATVHKCVSLSII